MGFFQFDPCTLPPEAEAVRQDIRAFLSERISSVPAEVRAQSWSASDISFSQALGDAGFIGMTWPKAYGGHERTAFERYVVLEELLAAGGPVGAHWIADRQSGPLILRVGTEAQKQKIIPEIARGRCYFCIGMSEPDSGSDLASVRSRAEQDGNDWIINGTKLWTSGAQNAHYMIGLFRTKTVEGSRHEGLTQFLIDMSTPGISVRPIKDITGDAHFNEVTFSDVRVSADSVLGEEGSGWAQVTSELALERSGPERFLSSYRLIVEMARLVENSPNERAEIVFGRLIAHLTTLRQMSLSVAGMLNRGENPALEAAVVKDLGAVLEQDIPQIAHDLFECIPDDANTANDYARVLSKIVQTSPSFSLRGGTREILRGIIARGIGLR